jgi:organic radical activating enzyme
VLEVFASIQGEGLYVGRPQVFLRLAGCPLRCRWCDTPGAWVVRAGSRARLRAASGGPGAESGPSGEGPGWASPLLAAAWISSADPHGERALSVTGGEPLLWPGFVAELCALVSPRRVHLETAGAHPLALARVLGAVDHVSLDLKLPADLDAPVWAPPPEAGEWQGEPAPRDAAQWAAARERALALVAGRDACAKLPVAGGRRTADFLPLLDDVQRLAPRLPLILQPVTPLGGARAPGRAELEALVEAALERDLDVRVLPQVHRALGVP